MIRSKLTWTWHKHHDRLARKTQEKPRHVYVYDWCPGKNHQNTEALCNWNYQMAIKASRELPLSLARFKNRDPLFMRSLIWSLNWLSIKEIFFIHIEPMKRREIKFYGSSRYFSDLMPSVSSIVSETVPLCSLRPFCNSFPVVSRLWRKYWTT